ASIRLQVITGYYLALRLAAAVRAALGLDDTTEPDAPADDATYAAATASLHAADSRPPPQRLVLQFLTRAVLTAAPPAAGAT
ncbi:MAG: hypothetical protein ACJ8LL_14420, partial [Candidatus Udaeobacter sp.]